MPDRALPKIKLLSMLSHVQEVLPEYRGKGIARRLTADAVRSIQRDHPIRELFYWSFSPEGTRLAKSVAGTLLLPLRERTD